MPKPYARSRHKNKSKDIQQLIKMLESYRPFVRASVVVTRKPCIRKGCAHCKKGRKHPFSYLTIKTKGKTQVRYLPKRLIPLALKQVKNYQKTKGIAERMSKLWLEELLAQRP